MKPQNHDLARRSTEPHLRKFSPWEATHKHSSNQTNGPWLQSQGLLSTIGPHHRNGLQDSPNTRAFARMDLREVPALLHEVRSAKRLQETSVNNLLWPIWLVAPNEFQRSLRSDQSPSMPTEAMPARHRLLQESKWPALAFEDCCL